LKKVVLLYGLAGGVLIAVLRTVEYRFVVVEHSIEIYGAVIAIVFAAVGVWLGLTLTNAKAPRAVPLVQTPAAPPFAPDDARVAALGITPRELEILQHIAMGKSTREIADGLFVSENTVKTHSSRLFGKLNVRRRTQAVHVGKQLGLIP
jgi:DNA-binding CsgD family transcriptional regulator